MIIYIVFKNNQIPQILKQSDFDFCYFIKITAKKEEFLYNYFEL